jgi:hypothetical protein
MLEFIGFGFRDTPSRIALPSCRWHGGCFNAATVWVAAHELSSVHE